MHATGMGLLIVIREFFTSLPLKPVSQAVHAKHSSHVWISVELGLRLAISFCILGAKRRRRYITTAAHLFLVSTLRIFALE